MTSSAAPVTIEPTGRGQGLGLGELWRYRSIALVLAKRNLKARYRQTLVGIAWVLLQPLILMIVFSIFFSLIARADRYGLPYPVFFLCGLVIWLPTVKTLNEGTISIVANIQLVTRIYLPRAFLPLSVAISTLVDLAFTFVALMLILLRFGYLPTLTALAMPIFILVAYVAVIGLTFWLSALNTTYRDVQVMLPFLAQVWFFSSPLLYPAEVIPAEFQPLYYLNPMALAMTGSRWALAGSPAPPDFGWILGITSSLVILASGYLFFHRRETTFSDVL
jgi:lipopolysaccharide transport system permease protein